MNASLSRNNDENMFVTSWIGILELTTGKLSYCNAGHNPPIIARRETDPELLIGPRSFILGAKEGMKYRMAEIVMEPGDRILLYTDGVTEANDHFDEFYGVERLINCLKNNEGASPDDQIKAITDDIAEFTKHAIQFDDITMLLLRYDGPAASGEPLLDSEDVPPVVASISDAVDVILDKEYA